MPSSLLCAFFFLSLFTFQDQVHNPLTEELTTKASPTTLTENTFTFDHFFFNDYVILLFLNISAGKGSCDVIPFYNPKYLAEKSIFTETYSLFMNA